MSPDTIWHGLKASQWQDCWGQLEWTRRIATELEDIATCREAGLEERLGALACLNEAIQLGLLDGSALVRPFPVLSRNVLFAAACDLLPPRWWKRRKRIKQRCIERLAAIRYMLRMAAEFTPALEVPAVPDAFAAAKKEMLFS